MTDATDRIQDIERQLVRLLKDARNGVVHLPEHGRIRLAHRFLEGVLDERIIKAQRVSAMVATQGGRDHSVPAGDR